MRVYFLQLLQDLGEQSILKVVLRSKISEERLDESLLGIDVEDQWNILIKDSV